MKTCLMEKLRPFVAIFQGHSLLTGYANLRADLLRAMAACDVNDSSIYGATSSSYTKVIERVSSTPIFVNGRPKRSIPSRPEISSRNSSVKSSRNASSRNAELHQMRSGQRRKRSARRNTPVPSGDIGLEDSRGCPTKDDALVRLLVKKAGVRPEIIIVMDRVIYVDEEE